MCTLMDFYSDLLNNLKMTLYLFEMFRRVGTCNRPFTTWGPTLATLCLEWMPTLLVTFDRALVCPTLFH